MQRVVDRLQSLRVIDVMSREVVSVSAHQPMGEAAAVFEQRRISGAPVLDEQGMCVGWLSARDFLKLQQMNASEGEIHVHDIEHHRLTLDDSSRSWQIEAQPSGQLVAAYMSTAVQTISATAPLLQAARVMTGQHVHRLVALDERAHPIGVISTLDIVATLLNAVQESVTFD